MLYLSSLNVIATKVCGISEMVDASNGFLIDTANEEILGITMVKMINEHICFKQKKISEEAHKAPYSYAVIAK